VSTLGALDGGITMNRGMIRRRLRALSSDDSGFTLIETVIAVTVIFGSLLSLAYTATIGFGYEDLARQKQAATGIADQIMEQARGLAWDRITAGHLASDITSTDPNLVTGCSGDAAGTYRLFSCTATSQPGSSEKVVKQSTTPCTTGSPGYPKCVYPLVVHSGTITENNITYTWWAYDTNSCPTTTSTGCPTVTAGTTTTGQTSPYRITVRVTWTGGKNAPNKVVQVQSLFWSPNGCRSTATHPFAAPCQPFLLGVATIPTGTINIAQGTDLSASAAVSGSTFVSADLNTTGVDSSVQSEQLSYASGSFTQSGVRLVDGAVTSTAGGTVAASSAADTDPGTTSSTYSSVICPDTTYPCTGGSVSTGGSNVVTLTAPGGDTGRSTSTTSATSVNVCPPPTDTAQLDAKPCGGSRILQGSTNTLSAKLTLNGTTPSLGAASLAKIFAPASVSKTFVDRVQNGQVPAGLCAPIASSNGCMEATATRTIGTLNIGAIPGSIPGTPAGWSGAQAWNGSYFSIVGYQDSVSALAGTNSTLSAAGANVAAPTATVNAGNVYCWNGVNNYNTVAASSATAVTCAPLVWSQTMGGHIVIVTMTGTTAPRQITLSPSSAAATQTDVTAQVTPPSATIEYGISVDGVTVVTVTITVDLHTLEARGSYSAAPTSGT
jgi:Tfp pilus assembly protein PilE